MKLMKKLKKGGVADVVTIIIIVGLVIALIVAFIVPWMNSASESGSNTTSDIGTIIEDIGTLRESNSDYGDDWDILG